MKKNNFESLIGKTISEAQNFLEDYKLQKIQSVEYECTLKSYFFGLIRKRLFLYCTDDMIRDLYIITY